MSDALLRDVRRHLDELRRRTGVRKGDEFDLILRSIEALAITIDTMTVDAAAAVAEGQRSVGAVVSASMTKSTIWRLAVLPAIVGALVSASIFGFTTATQAIVAQRMIQADHDLLAARAEADRVAADRQFEELRADLGRQRGEVEAERQQIEATLPSLLLKQAETLTAAARDIVHQEAAAPGFIDFIAREGADALRVYRLNGGSLCPLKAYQGPTLYCEYRIE